MYKVTKLLGKDFRCKVTKEGLYTEDDFFVPKRVDNGKAMVYGTLETELTHGIEISIKLEDFYSDFYYMNKVNQFTIWKNPVTGLVVKVQGFTKGYDRKTIVYFSVVHTGKFSTYTKGEVSSMELPHFILAFVEGSIQNN